MNPCRTDSVFVAPQRGQGLDITKTSQPGESGHAAKQLGGTIIAKCPRPFKSTAPIHCNADVAFAKSSGSNLAHSGRIANRTLAPEVVGPSPAMGAQAPSALQRVWPQSGARRVFDFAYFITPTDASQAFPIAKLGPEVAYNRQGEYRWLPNCYGEGLL